MNTNSIEYKHYKVTLKFEGISDVLMYANSVDEAEEIALTIPISVSDDLIEIESKFIDLDIVDKTIEVDASKFNYVSKFYRSYFSLENDALNK